MDRKTLLIGGLAGLIVGSLFTFLMMRDGTGSGLSDGPALPSEGGDVVRSEPGNLAMGIKGDLIPVLETVPGLNEGDAFRPVGRVEYSDGETSDLVLGELIVVTDTDEEIQGFLARHDAELVDTFAGEGDDPDEHLVRVPLTGVDPGEVAAAVAAIEPGHEGLYQVSDSYVLTMLLIAATEKTDHGLDVFLNLVATADDIADGDVQEAEDQDNPFNWTYLRVGGPVDTGVTGAWQLLHSQGRLDTSVKVMIADGGFFENDDFPDVRKIRLASWDVKNPGSCGNGKDDCPTHGTDVALTAVGKVDNGFGTAGVAGPVGELIAVQAHGDFWTEMRKIKRTVDEERPAVVNMSFSWETKTFRAANEASADRHLKKMREYGALVFASAGNDGKDVDRRKCIGNNCFESSLTIPCESRYAICIGGHQSTNAWLHEGSNHGTAGGSRSVQMYAPFCVITLFNPVSQTIDDTEWICGTSFSSPFVAGAAALVKAADPGLGPTEIWDVLRLSANVGGVHFDHYISTEDQLRVNALDAVAMALGIEQSDPEVSITSPSNGEEFGITDWFELEGSAVDFKGEHLPITWHSDIEGPLGTSLDPQTVFELTAGEHTITASAKDVNGNESTDTILIDVLDLPPEMAISWPAPDSIVYESEALVLIGSSEDPDTYQSLREGDVEWEIMKNGQVVHGAAGHVVEVAGGILAPGNYDIVFRGYDSGGIGEAETSIIVLEVIGSLPDAFITTQFSEAPYGSHNGTPREFTLKGFGFDADDGALPGTQYRWRARADNGHEELLCTGSSFDEPEVPAPFNPGFQIAPPTTQPPLVIGIFVDCSEIDIELGLAPGAVGQTVWAIILEVMDSDGQVGTDVANVTIRFVTG